MRKVTASDSYSVADAHRDVWEAILRVVARDMELEIEAGERLLREGKGTPDGMMAANHVPTCVAATREILADMRFRASPASRTEETPACATCADWRRREGKYGICHATGTPAYQSDSCEAWRASKPNGSAEGSR